MNIDAIKNLKEQRERELSQHINKINNEFEQLGIGLSVDFYIACLEQTTSIGGTVHNVFAAAIELSLK